MALTYHEGLLLSAITGVETMKQPSEEELYLLYGICMCRRHDQLQLLQILQRAHGAPELAVLQRLPRAIIEQQLRKR